MSYNDIKKLFEKEKNIDVPQVEINLAEGGKCQRCWKISDEVNEKNDICVRCNDIVSKSK